MDLEVIKIAENTTNYKYIKNHSHKYKHKNTICGDEIEITLKIRDRKIIDFGYQTKSCIYCQASASLLSRISKNKKIYEVNKFLKLQMIYFKMSINQLQNIGNLLIQFLKKITSKEKIVYYCQ